MDYKDICEKTVAVVKDVAVFIEGTRNHFSEADVESKSLNSLVSFVDKTAEQRLVSALEKLVPEAGFVAEEGTSDKTGERFNWVIDPLDGTTNFIHGLPLYSISVALMEEGLPVIGVVHEIRQNECFYSWKGGPALLNGQPISVTKTATLPDTLLATGFPYHDFDRLPAFLEVLTAFMKTTRGIRRLGSAAVDLAYVACGRFDGFFEYGLNPWDVAAGAFIVEQAGGKSGYFSNRKEFTDGSEILASNGLIHEDMQQILNACF